MLTGISVIWSAEAFGHREDFLAFLRFLVFFSINRAALILLAFVYASRLICAYLNYKVYPAAGVEPGLAYAIDTFLQYFLMFFGGLTVLQVVGFDLRALLAFAGAIGIGIGLAMQGIVANLMSDVIVNYSLSDPLIRISVPFGVSYDADPHAVARLAERVAEKEPLLTKSRRPEARFVEYGDNSINFQLLVWIDVRKVAAQMVRSSLYFALFDALKRAGIEIPFPQRDLHIRSGLPEVWQPPKME